MTESQKFIATGIYLFCSILFGAMAFTCWYGAIATGKAELIGIGVIFLMVAAGSLFATIACIGTTPIK